MSVCAQAKARRKAALVRRNHGYSYKERRSFMVSSVIKNELFAKVSKTAKKSGARR
jgi:hypothetical protein